MQRKAYNREMTEGRLHPITVAVREIADIFGRMGFGIAYGPELEDEWHNFSALNVPSDHPARDMQDTFWLKGMDAAEGRVMRTHTSPVQVRYMEEQLRKGIQPPYRIIVPGKVFRNEATDATHEAQFYQNEGLVVGEGVTLAQMKGTLDQFFKEYLGPEAKVRFRPSFFPFTEPSVEVDVWFEQESKEGRWLEVMGGGMVNPVVLANVGLDTNRYQGFAFGVGIERLLILKHGIPDVRLFHSGDLRFVHGFEESKEFQGETLK
jgi:phenylalanyl-tRNA synthetase alpha chain